MLSRDATNTNLIVFDLNRSGLEPTIYHTPGEHVNHIHHQCGSSTEGSQYLVESEVEIEIISGFNFHICCKSIFIIQCEY